MSQLAVFAFCLYMILDLFSPIYRIQYYSVQWLFPLLLIATSWESRQWKPVAVSAVYLLLTIIHLPYGVKQNTLEEYVLLAFLLGFALSARGEQAPKASPASAPNLR